MGRGAAAPVGAERWSNNGYHYTKTREGWELTSRVMMAKHLNRALLPNERVVFKNGDRRDLRIENLEVAIVKSDRAVLERRLATIEDKIRELTAMKMETEEELEKVKAKEVGGIS